jgi:hypothetical protein
MKHSTKPTESINELKRRSAVGRYVVIAVVVLAAALLLGSSPTTSSSDGELTTHGVVWGIVSFAGVLALFWAMYVGYRRADERQQSIQLKAASLSFVAVLLGLFITEMLQATITINLAVAVQILFMGGIIAWMGFTKLFEARDRQ